MHWFSAVYLAARFMRFSKVFRATLGAVLTSSCVCGNIHILNLKLFTVTPWVFRQWLDLRWGYLHEDLPIWTISWVLYDLQSYKSHARGRWCHAMLWNYVLRYAKYHKTHVRCEGGADIFLELIEWPQANLRLWLVKCIPEEDIVWLQMSVCSALLVCVLTDVTFNPSKHQNKIWQGDWQMRSDNM